MAIPGPHLVDHDHRVASSVGLGDVAREPLVRDVRVVFEGAGRLDDVDAAPLLAPRNRRSKFGRPYSRFEQRSEVNVVRDATLVVVGELAGETRSPISNEVLVPWK